MNWIRKVANKSVEKVGKSFPPKAFSWYIDEPQYTRNGNYYYQTNGVTASEIKHENEMDNDYRMGYDYSDLNIR